MLPQDPILIKPRQLNEAADNTVSVQPAKVTDCIYFFEESPVSDTTTLKGTIDYPGNDLSKISKYTAEKLIGKDCGFLNRIYYHKTYPHTAQLNEKITGLPIVISLIANNIRVYAATLRLLLNNYQNRQSYE